MRTGALDKDSIWAHGDSTATAGRGPSLARADIKAQDVRDCWRKADLPLFRRLRWRLHVISDEPPPKHALIVGWPPTSKSDARRALAAVLVTVAKLVVR